METLHKKLAEKEKLSVIQKRYHNTEKGRRKVERNNTHRRLKTQKKKVLRELVLLTTLRRIELHPAFNYVLRRT